MKEIVHDPTVEFDDNPKQSRPKWLLPLVILIGLGMLGAAIFALTSNTPTVKKEKAELKVGSFRYIDACRMIPFEKYQKIFGTPLTKNSIVTNVYRETISLSAKEDYVKTDCTIKFGKEEKTSFDHSLSLMLYQLQTTDEAKKEFAKNTEKMTIVPGVENFFYRQNSEEEVTYRFLIQNVLVNLEYSVPKGSGLVAPESISSRAQKLNSVVQASLNNRTLEQHPSFAEGSTKVLHPCTIFTASDYTKVFKISPDPRALTLKYKTPVSAQTFEKATEDTINQVMPSCNRHEKGLEDPIYEYGEKKITKEEYAARKEVFEKTFYWDATVSVGAFTSAKTAKAASEKLQQYYQDAARTNVSSLGNTVVVVRTAPGAETKDSAMIVQKDNVLLLIKMQKKQDKFLAAFTQYEQANDAQYTALAELILKRL